MTKGFWACGILLPILLWFSFFFVLQENFRVRQLYIENTVFEYTQLVAKKGSFHKATFNEMYEKLKSNGAFEVYMTTTKQRASGAVVESGYTLLNRNLREEGFDKIEITVVYTKKHPLSAVLNHNFFFGEGERNGDIILGASSSCLIQ